MGCVPLGITQNERRAMGFSGQTPPHVFHGARKITCFDTQLSAQSIQRVLFKCYVVQIALHDVPLAAQTLTKPAQRLKQS